MTTTLGTPTPSAEATRPVSPSAVPWPTVWARGAVAAAGTMAFGSAAEIHLLLAVGLIAVWVWYTTTVPAWRSGGLLLLGLTAGVVARSALPVSY